jgi:hypothetical protein
MLIAAGLIAALANLAMAGDLSAQDASKAPAPDSKGGASSATEGRSGPARAPRAPSGGEERQAPKEAEPDNGFADPGGGCRYHQRKLELIV